MSANMHDDCRAPDLRHELSEMERRLELTIAAAVSIATLVLSGLMLVLTGTLMHY